MTSNKWFSTRQIASAVLALAVTVAVHGSWLSGMDHDAMAVIAATDVA